jgi:hypothetical protein
MVSGRIARPLTAISFGFVMCATCARAGVQPAFAASLFNERKRLNQLDACCASAQNALPLLHRGVARPLE